MQATYRTCESQDCRPSRTGVIFLDYGHGCPRCGEKGQARYLFTPGNPGASRGGVVRIGGADLARIVRAAAERATNPEAGEHLGQIQINF